MSRNSDELNPIITQQVDMFRDSQIQYENCGLISDQDSIIKEEEPEVPTKTPLDKSLLNELERLIINLNHTAMTFLKSNQFDFAKELLKKAEVHLLNVDTQVPSKTESLESGGISALSTLKNKLLGLTYNNLGCVAKQKLEFQEALDYLKKALVYESAQEEN